MSVSQSSPGIPQSTRLVTHLLSAAGTSGRTAASRHLADPWLPFPCTVALTA